MSESTLERARRAGEDSLSRGIVIIVVAGLALGIAYIWLGQRSRPRWGLTWIAEDRLAAMPSLDEVAALDGAAGGGAAGPVSDDPMAIPPGGGVAAGLPEIPALDRPIEIQLAAVKQLVDAGAALVVDAREPDEYAEGHIPGAVNLPFDEATSEPERLEGLPSGGRPIVVYCGGGSCELSLSLAWELIFAGHTRVTVYMGGFPEWVAAGYPTATVSGQP
jgi:rhodanese-related sulfurtransferase